MSQPKKRGVEILKPTEFLTNVEFDGSKDRDDEQVEIIELDSQEEPTFVEKMSA